MTIPNFLRLLQGVLLGDINAWTQWNHYKKSNAFSENFINEVLSILQEKLIQNPNDSYALILRAYMHQFGQGGPVNYTAAVDLYEQAIELGNSESMSNRACMHVFGQGGLVNYVAAIDLFEQAIELGHSTAMSNRASMHFFGQGGPVNYAAAIDLFERAIELDNSTAMNNRASMHMFGQGGPVNYAAAILLYDRAIKLGNTTAMNNRAYMHFNGQGGSVDHNAAIALYKHAYFIEQNEPPLSALKHIFEKTKSLKARHALILCYLKSDQINAARILSAQHDRELNLLLYPFLHQSMNELPKNIQFTQRLIDFFTEIYDGENDDERLKYIQFKIALYNKEEQLAFDLYAAYLGENHQLTAFDFYRLGSFCLSGIEGLSPENKIKKWEQACEFFLKGFHQGDKDCKTMLIHILAAKEALEAGLSAPRYCLQKNVEQANYQNQELINRFSHKIQQNRREASTLHKTALLTFITIKKHRLQKGKTSSKSMKLAQKIVPALNHAPLEIILKKPQVLNHIKKEGALYKILNGFFASDEDNPLKLIMNEHDCQAIIKQTNSGRAIYQVLTTGKYISSKGLRILAQHQGQTLDYIKSLSGKIQEDALKKALDSNSSLGQYFHLKCCFFTPHGTQYPLKALKQMHKMKP
ncbi:tetratricopeptide repeat protein [Legionella sp.]|uniref:tetratricopeptide repeat protein n=1 Tax=Legionella sp. TaxID=459 RepID=UPI003CA5921F